MLIDTFKDAVLAQVIKIDSLPNPSTDAARIQVILNIVFGIAGSIALLVITVAGFKYVLSHGDPNLIAEAKNAIVYALVGLIVSIAAIGIVNFVVNGVG